MPLNYKNEIQIKITEDIAELLRAPEVITSGCVYNHYVTYDVDESWKGLEKRAVIMAVPPGYPRLPANFPGAIIRTETITGSAYGPDDLKFSTTLTSASKDVLVFAGYTLMVGLHGYIDGKRVKNSTYVEVAKIVQGADPFEDSGYDIPESMYASLKREFENFKFDITTLVPRDKQATKTTDMTTPVGIDSEGKLWTNSGSDSGSDSSLVVTISSVFDPDHQRMETFSSVSGEDIRKKLSVDYPPKLQVSLIDVRNGRHGFMIYAPEQEGQAAKFITYVDGGFIVYSIDYYSRSVTEEPISLSADFFVVKITYTSEGYRSDKTVSEIQSALNSGKQVRFLTADNTEGFLVESFSNMITFWSIDTSEGGSAPTLWLYTVRDSGVTKESGRISTSNATGIDIEELSDVEIENIWKEQEVENG